MKKDFTAGSFAARRPFLASECESLGEAERWRLQIIRDLSRKVSAIQNSGLGEHKIRDLNDKINKLLREKMHWQHRIRQLGGPDYNATERDNRLPGEDEATPQGGEGGPGAYKYFGAAKQLPGVKELFAKKPPTKKKRTRAEISENVTPDYYAFRDDELYPEMREAEARLDEKSKETVAAELQSRADRRKKEKERKRLMGEDPGDVSSSDDESVELKRMFEQVEKLNSLASTSQTAPDRTNYLSARKKELLDLINAERLLDQPAPDNAAFEK